MSYKTLLLFLYDSSYDNIQSSVHKPHAHTLLICVFRDEKFRAFRGPVRNVQIELEDFEFHRRAYRDEVQKLLLLFNLYELYLQIIS